MACPLWGDGSLWGDGDLWCRQFGSSPYHVENVDTNIRRCSVSVTYAGSGLFIIDRIAPNIDYGRSQQSYTYDAWLDVDSGQRVSTQLAYSGNASIVVRAIIPHVRLKKHQPVG